MASTDDVGEKPVADPRISSLEKSYESEGSLSLDWTAEEEVKAKRKYVTLVAPPGQTS